MNFGVCVCENLHSKENQAEADQEDKAKKDESKVTSALYGYIIMPKYTISLANYIKS